MSLLSYLQHGRRHGPQGSDPIPGFGITNDWVLAFTGATSVSSTGPSSPTLTNIPFDSIGYQTDDGSIYATATGAVNYISIKVAGTYLVHVFGNYGEGNSGYGMASANIAGDVVAYDYSVSRVYPLSWSGTGGGLTVWEQLVVVNDLTIPAGAYGLVWQSSGAPLDVDLTLQIIRLT